MVRIQGEVQIGRLELKCGTKQDPLASRGIMDLIPFQTQEPEPRGQEKRLPYLIYFF
jgi:hypothetical protein